MLSKLRAWWRKRTGRDKCKYCQGALDEFDYCYPCNRFPWRKWINEGDALFLDDEAFRRANPEEYERHENEMRKLNARRLVREGKIERRHIVTIYGEEMVTELEQEMQAEQ